ncbi:MAG: permease [Alphaproteobacteria bacterium]
MTNLSDRQVKEESLLRRSFGASLFVFFGLALGAGFSVYFFKGPTVYERAIQDAWDLMLFIAPRVGAAVLIAAFLQILVPKEVISRLIGENAGVKSVIIATFAGALTPGGPLTSFPVVIALYAAGANKGALVAYLSSWAIIGMQRIIVWELPLLGPDVTAVRVGASILLPVIAGTIALYLPIRLKVHAPPRVK